MQLDSMFVTVPIENSEARRIRRWDEKRQRYIITVLPPVITGQSVWFGGVTR